MTNIEKDQYNLIQANIELQNEVNSNNKITFEKGRVE